MKKRELAIGLAILGTVSSLCLKGMKWVGKQIEERNRREEEQTERLTPTRGRKMCLEQQMLGA